MFVIVGNLAFIAALLVLNEYLWEKKILKGEAARKFMHIIIGVYGAFWPFIMTWQQVQIIGLIAISAILGMRFTKLFKSVYAIERKSWGDLIGPATIVLMSFMQPSKWFFAAAVLHIALADGLAALVGSKYGKKNQYKILGNTKSISGTITFYVVSFCILAILSLISPEEFRGVTPLVMVGLPLLTAFLENIAPYGSDNFFVAMSTMIVLQMTV